MTLKKIFSTFAMIALLTGCAKSFSLMDYGERMQLAQQFEQKCRALGLKDQKQIDNCVVTEIQVRENRIRLADQRIIVYGR